MLDDANPAEWTTAAVSAPGTVLPVVLSSSSREPCCSLISHCSVATGAAESVTPAFDETTLSRHNASDGVHDNVCRVRCSLQGLASAEC